MTDLVLHSNIEALVRTYQAAELAIRESFARIHQAEEALQSTFSLNGSWSLYIARESRVSWSCPEDVIKTLRRDAWTVLIERLEIRRMASAARWEALQRQLREEPPEEITEETVKGMVRYFSHNLEEMLEEAVREVFEWLRPPRSKYKSNSEYEVPRKVVLTSVVDPWTSPYSRWWVCYYSEARLTALENVFTALDGKGQITKNYYSQISSVIKAPEYAGEGETPYFKFRTFKNGNMHLWFLRLDLLKKFNAVAGGATLKGTHGGVPDDQAIQVSSA